MQFSVTPTGREQTIVNLFTATFTASEGADEGELIGKLARELLADTPAPDIHVVMVDDQAGLMAACIFSRLVYEQDARTVFVLAPVAVRPDKQGLGIGQAMLTYGLNSLRYYGVEVVMTYGDPAYYSKVGFQPVSEHHAAAPFPLEYPHGWQGQSLTDRPLSALQGPSRCVAALNHPAFW